MFELLLVCAYLIGSLSFAIMLSRYYGNSDPRSQGSGNPGATNMLRIAGKRLAILTLLGDLSKGLLPILIARRLGLDQQQQAWIGLAAVIGHLYPLYFSFRGGKGVATTAGMLLALYPPAALLALAVWLLTFNLTRISSLASLASVPLCLPLLAWQQPHALLPVSVLSMLLVWRHRSNLKDLLAGNERSFKDEKLP
ncbi:MAG: glycerol-3-phosphate 1-O-acyltransferase PlsY [Pseudomonas sp.]|jgi:glycerol-3-phosphate acyltransferase PlsY|nr:glycerol-3-phosphate 1-O-acyltransferase PlsY [Pseudomonas sp.]